MALATTTQSKEILGDFQEKEHGNWFSYSNTTDEWTIAHGFINEIDVLDGVRFACVRKTRVKVVVDVDSDGFPVIETWLIKNHNIFTKEV